MQESLFNDIQPNDLRQPQLHKASVVGSTGNKDWTGNNKSVFSTLGASSHSKGERQKHDFYATDPKAIEWLLKLETFTDVWECACGQGHLSKVLMDAGIHKRSTDLIDRGFGESGIDFLGLEVQEWDGDIITNPPFKYAKEFVLKALQIIPTGNKVAMFLRMQFLESQDRKHLFIDFPPKKVLVTSSRISCAINGDFENNSGGAMAYCWFVWEKGFKGKTTIEWFNYELLVALPTTEKHLCQAGINATYYQPQAVRPLAQMQCCTLLI